jgi:hypothetical protein
MVRPQRATSSFRNSQVGGKPCARLSPGSAQKGGDAASAAGEDCGLGAAVGPLGRLLFVRRAGVDRAIEVVAGQLALDVLA